MSAEVQVELIKKIVRDWALSNDCGGVDALIAIMEILDYNPYEEQRLKMEVIAGRLVECDCGALVKP